MLSHLVWLPSGLVSVELTSYIEAQYKLLGNTFSDNFRFSVTCSHCLNSSLFIPVRSLMYSSEKLALGLQRSFHFSMSDLRRGLSGPPMSFVSTGAVKYLRPGSGSASLLGLSELSSVALRFACFDLQLKNILKE